MRLHSPAFGHAPKLLSVFFSHACLYHQLFLYQSAEKAGLSTVNPYIDAVPQSNLRASFRRLTNTEKW